MQSIEPGISRFRVWSFGPSRNDRSINSIAPPPTPGDGVIRFGPARHFCEGEAFRRAELRCDFDLADRRLRQRARGTLRDRCAGQRNISKLLILEWQLRALD